MTLATSPAFSGFSTDDVAAAHAFYSGVLGLEVTEEHGILTLQLDGGKRPTIVYPKGPDHVPAQYTVLNFPVEDIEAAVDELAARGVTFERYPGSPMADAIDERGVFRGGGPLIAWFTDPAGNVLSLIVPA
ncbi:MAG: glyoxalase [Solirubrobacterales bacterium]|nr:glyoxalase [Solirubrobacterales bacterium]